MEPHTWVFKTHSFQKMHGAQPGGELGVDNDFAERAMNNLGAWILGRNMFGPVRGPWIDHSWKGWWGPNPPYHVPVYVLTHHPREPLVMEGGTTFYFVTDGIESALEQAKAAAKAKAKDIRVGGGVTTIRQYLQQGLIDEMHLAYSPVFLDEGENLFQGLNLTQLGFQKTSHVTTAEAVHVILEKR